MSGVKATIDNVNFDADPNYALVTFRVPTSARWYAGDYLIRQAFSVELEKQEASDPRPHNCRDRLQQEGQSYPKSGCWACSKNIFEPCPHSSGSVKCAPKETGK